MELVIFNSKFEYSTLLQFLSCTFSNVQDDHCSRGGENSSCSNITGVIGDLDFETAIDVLASTTNQNVVQVFGAPSSNSLPVKHSATFKVVDMNPLLVSLLKKLNWTRIALIVENADYHRYEAELLQKELLSVGGVIVAPYVGVSPLDSHKHVPQRIKRLGTYIIIILASERTASSILREATRLNMMWPSYAWIVHTPYTEKILDMEGLIILNQYSVQENIMALEFFEEICEQVAKCISASTNSL